MRRTGTQVDGVSFTGGGPFGAGSQVAALLDIDVVTTGVLYEVSHPTLVDEILEIRWKAQGDKQPPTRKDLLKAFTPAF